MEAANKRYPRSYKVNNVAYKRAMKRAAKDKVKLASILESFVYAYGWGEKNYNIESKSSSKKQ